MTEQTAWGSAIGRDEIQLLVTRGEGPHIEFKRDFPKQAHDVAKTIAAFANSGGGVFVLGVEDIGNICGVPHPGVAVERLSQIVRTCSPAPWTFIEQVKINDLIVVYASVSPSGPCLYQAKLYIRVGSTSVEGSGADAASIFRSVQSRLPHQLAGHCPTIATAHDVVMWGWSGQQLLDRLIQLDYATMAGITGESEGNTQQWAPVFMEHPDTWRLLIDGPENIVGYWHFVPLEDSDFRLAKSGQLLDSQISSDQLCFFELPGSYCIYFVSITILPLYKTVSNFSLLLDSFFAQLTYLAENDVFVGEICANAITDYGRSMCRRLEMELVCDHKHQGTIFHRTIKPLPDLKLFKKYPRLVQLYSGQNINGA